MYGSAGQVRDFIKLVTYDLFSLNFPVTDYMLIPSFTYPYAYHVKCALACGALILKSIMILQV